MTETKKIKSAILIAKEADEQNKEYEFAVADTNVQLEDTQNSKKFTLRTFYNNWKAFKQNAHFIRWTDTQPQNNNTKIWYNPNWQ